MKTKTISSAWKTRKHSLVSKSSFFYAEKVLTGEISIEYDFENIIKIGRKSLSKNSKCSGETRKA